MTVDEFLERASNQQPVTVRRMVSIPGPELKALLAESKPILISELQAHPDQRQESRTFRYGHILGSGLVNSDIVAWQRSHPEYRLPLDMVDLLTRANGIHLWADLDLSRSYFGFSPLDEWADAKDVDWGTMFDSSPLGKVVTSYHDNGDSYLVLDTHRQEYWWYDLQDFDHPKHAGNRVEELLDFWWQESAWLDPRNDVAG